MITDDSLEAEHFVAQCKREMQLHPRQPVQIRADFARKGFCLYRNGEAVGFTGTYKKTWLTREWLAREQA